ncbi:MAG: hypothetical protein PW844_15385 [Pantoea sp.]|uniref:hypothetical protein n=1 Tax=Pantoea sp. TaxID=69393 RepID=UPI0023988D5A|nr:hypothetical protein [Pantoea sp.]MDE1187844.1 hypothetical protein [Pantoea sp.]
MTLVSFLLSGYLPLYNNNIYHTPILLKTYDLPQFANDAFVQSLRYFSSGFWIVFAGAGFYVNVKVFFAIWLVVTHFGFLAASLHFAQSTGLRDRVQLNIFSLLICCSPLLYGIAVGGGGLMLNYFTHSELANAGLLLGISYAIRGRYGYCAVAVCATFFLNAFMAVWMLPPIVLLTAYHLLSGKISLRRYLMNAASGSVVGSLFLIVPILNVLHNPDAGDVGDFSYQEFLWSFFPNHFFFSSLAYKELCLVAISIAGLFLTARLYGRYAGEMLMLALGCVVLLFMAAVVPMITDSRMALNLHLVRGFVMIAILAALSLAIVASRWITERGNYYLTSLGLVMAAALTIHKYGITIAVAVLLVELTARYSAVSAALLRQKAVRPVIWICLFGSFVSVLIRSANAVDDSANGIAFESTWERVGTWASHSTPANSIFQVPHDAAPAFSYASNRRLWFDSKYGAAVMWSPSYHQIWQTRHAAGADLSDFRQSIHESDGQIDYVATECSGQIDKVPEYKEDDICVYKTK